MKRSTAMRMSGVIALSYGLIFTGCAMIEPDITQDPDFGQSVRHTIALQTADPWASAPGMDAQKASTVLSTYRKQVGEPKRIEQDMIDIELGN